MSNKNTLFSDNQVFVLGAVAVAIALIATGNAVWLWVLAFLFFL